MDIDIALSFIAENVLIVVPVLWLIGYFLKSTPKIKDWIIPWVLVAVGIILAVGIMGMCVEAVLQGVQLPGLF